METKLSYIIKFQSYFKLNICNSFNKKKYITIYELFSYKFNNKKIYV